MKLTLNLFLFLFLFALVIYGDKSFSLTDYQIKRFCQKDKRVPNCIKNIKKKRYDLKNGKLIEVPIIPHRR